ncbi:hypothetical protein HYS47_01350 [Candidatus Woesearchaeota archaeon]|nr:hypothetical protein [Candidatus Woesearchaeota archaeon]
MDDPGLDQNVFMAVHYSSERYDRARELAGFYFSDVQQDLSRIAERTRALLGQHNNHDCSESNDISIAANYAQAQLMFDHDELDEAISFVHQISTEACFWYYDTALHAGFKVGFPNICRGAKELLIPRRMDEVLLHRHAVRMEDADHTNWYNNRVVVIATPGNGGYECRGIIATEALFAMPTPGIADGNAFANVQLGSVIGTFVRDVPSWDHVRGTAQEYAALGNGSRTVIEANHSGLSTYLASRFVVKQVGMRLPEEHAGCSVSSANSSNLH